MQYSNMQFPNQAAELFRLIFTRCSAGFLAIRSFSKGKTNQRFLAIPSAVDDAANFAISLRDDVFFGVGVRSEPKGTADSVSLLPVRWVDADDNALPWTNFPLQPLAIVGSGHLSGTHFHAYYASDPPYELGTESGRAKALVYLEALCAAFKGEGNRDKRRTSGEKGRTPQGDTSDIRPGGNVPLSARAGLSGSGA